MNSASSGSPNRTGWLPALTDADTAARFSKSTVFHELRRSFVSFRRKGAPMRLSPLDVIPLYTHA